jgi:hypothetical protein
MRYRPGMGKYDPLAQFLQTAARPCSLTFAQIDSLVGGLPASARAHREWWGNDRYHVQARAWLSVNRPVGEIDLGRAIVRFD